MSIQTIEQELLKLPISAQMKIAQRILTRISKVVFKEENDLDTPEYWIEYEDELTNRVEAYTQSTHNKIPTTIKNERISSISIQNSGQTFDQQRAQRRLKEAKLI